MKKFLLIAIATLGVGSLAQADIWCGVKQHPNEVPLWRQSTGSFVSGNQLYDWCTTVNWALCDGYIEAAADVFTDQNANNVCIPEGQSGVTVEEVVDVVKKYMHDNPATRHYTAISIILVAFEQAFPCGKS
jgi:hypothetical protein